MEVRTPEGKPASLESVTFGAAIPVQGGAAYFCRLMSAGIPGLQVQLPPCTTKSGLVTTNRATYAELVYSADSCAPLLEWLDTASDKMLSHVREQWEEWFDPPVDEDEIVESVTQVARLGSGGKDVIIKTPLPSRDDENFAVYDKAGEPLPREEMTAGRYIVPLIELRGIRVSAKSISLDIRLIQTMMIERPAERKCMIRTGTDVMEPRLNAEQHQKPIGAGREENDVPKVAVLPPPIEEDLHLEDRETVVREIYESACQRAKSLAEAAARARMEANGIREKYAIDDLYTDDDAGSCTTP